LSPRQWFDRGLFLGLRSAHLLPPSICSTVSSHRPAAVRPIACWSTLMSGAIGMSAVARWEPLAGSDRGKCGPVGPSRAARPTRQPVASAARRRGR